MTRLIYWLSLMNDERHFNVDKGAGGE